MTRVLTCGTFDIFHIGHLRLLQRAAKLGNELIVGVSSDEMNFNKKNKYPVYKLEHRMEILSNLSFVTKVFVEESLEEKRNYIMEHKSDIFVIGDDWKGKFDFLKDICSVEYLKRTPSVSTTEIIEIIKAID